MGRKCNESRRACARRLSSGRDRRKLGGKLRRGYQPRRLGRGEPNNSKKGGDENRIGRRGRRDRAVPTDASGHRPEPEFDRLRNILRAFNDQFSTLFTDAGRAPKRIPDDIAPKVTAYAAYQNA